VKTVEVGSLLWNPKKGIKEKILQENFEERCVIINDKISYKG